MIKKVIFQKFVRKALIATMLCSCLTMGAANCIYAAESEPADDSGIVAHLEQTEWHYREYNGRWQRRLWSITERKWLTEWEYI